MKVQIVACGQSASTWHEHKSEFDLSIGVNDCAKWGHAPDHLLVIDSPKRFTKERIDIIKSTPAKFFTRDDQWKSILPSYEKVRLQPFSKHLKKGHVYSSKTSPFVALSLAFNMGATDVVLFGVDLINHQTFNPKNKLRDYELRQYENFCRLLLAQGTQTWISSEESALSKFLPVWKNSEELMRSEMVTEFGQVLIDSNDKQGCKE